MVDLSLFKKVEVTGKNINRGKMVTLKVSGKNSYILLNSEIVKELGVVGGDRYDLYQMGSTFALKPDKVGYLTARATGSCAYIRNLSAVLTLAAASGENRRFDAWIDENVIFFRVNKEEK